jgi:hypothetical protein
MTYKFIEELKTLLLEKDSEWLDELELAEILSPNLIGPAIKTKYPSCPIGTSNYRDGKTIAWLTLHYEAAE